MSAQQKNNETLSSTQVVRKAAAGVLARANTDELEATLTVLAHDEAITPLRGPESGLVMLRGKIGGGGGVFNLGEASMSRASVKLSDGLVGHGQCLGTDRKKAQMIAVLDALLQRPAMAKKIETTLLSTVRARLDQQAQQETEETAATRVDFFTMVRGDN